MIKITGRMIDTDPTDDAQQICDIAEQALGINLCNRSVENPNDVHGYLDTNSDGTITVHLYEEKDVEIHNPQSIANIKACALSDEEIISKLQLIDQAREDFELTSGVIKEEQQ